MFGKYNGFVSKARVSACMHFLVIDYIIYACPKSEVNASHYLPELTPIPQETYFAL
jgi:hypothetical protein